MLRKNYVIVKNLRGNKQKKISPLCYMFREKFIDIFSFILVIIFLTNCSRTLIIRNEPEKHIGWNLFGGDSKHSNNIFSSLNSPLKVKWKFKTSSSIGTSPIVSNGIIYVPTLDGRIEAFNIKNGHKSGKIKTNIGIIAAPIFHKGNLYYAVSKGRDTFLCYNVSKGRHLWKRELGFIEASPVINEDKIFIGTLNGKIFCINSEDGEILWQTDVDDSIYSSPVVVENFLIVCTMSGKIYLFNSSNGEKLWEKEIKSSIFSSPSVNDNTIFIGTIGKIFYALNMENGDIKWEFKTEGKIYSTPAVNETMVMFGCNDKFLYAIDQKNGKLLWKFNSNGLINASPVIAGKSVYFGSLNHDIFELDISNGDLKWKFRASGKIKCSPVIYKNYLIVASEKRELFVFSGNNEKNGS